MILIRHSQPQITSNLPAREWELSDTGRQRCGLLAQRIRPFQPTRVFTSREPKAIETARNVAASLALPWVIAPDIHEHDRTGVTYHPDRTAFERGVTQFFDHPATLVFGRETADQAHRRFGDAVDGLVASHPKETLAIVSHGTVISLFVARAVGLEPVSFWHRLGMPAYVVLRLYPGEGTAESAEIIGQWNWDEA